MSRSRRDWDKDRRHRLGQAAAQAFAQERAQSDGPSVELVQAAKGETLKPHLVKFILAKRPPHKILHLVCNIIQRSRIWVFAEETRKDGNKWFQCQMQIHDDHEANIDTDQLPFLIKELAEIDCLVGRERTLYFWFPSPEPALNE